MGLDASRPHTLTVTDKDMFGQEIEGFIPINFVVIPPDCPKPRIDGNKSDPKDGAKDVPPKKFTGKLDVVFDRRLSKVKVINTTPSFPFVEEVSSEGLSTTLTISFLDGYVMPYDTVFTIELVGKAYLDCRTLHSISDDETISNRGLSSTFNIFFSRFHLGIPTAESISPVIV